MAQTIRDTDYLTATMRVRALERTLFDKERTERLIDARGGDDVIKVLTECGYGEMRALTVSELDRVLSSARSELYEFVGSMTKSPEVIDVFRLRYDYHNAKALIKSGATGESAEALLLQGRVPRKTMLEAFRSLTFNILPPRLADAVTDARELLARTGDPQRADFLMDSACTEETLELAVNSGSDFLLSYTRLTIDVNNLRSVVRAQRIGKGPDFLRLVLCPGGNVELSRISALLMSGGSLAELYSYGALADAAEAGEQAQRGIGSLTEFEKKCDDALLRQARSARFVAFGIEPLVSYLTEREAEITMLRTVISGRLSGVPTEQIRARLRYIYS